MTTLSFINETAGLITALLLIAAGFYFSAKTGFFHLQEPSALAISSAFLLR